jgi:hypothetical protein
LAVVAVPRSVGADDLGLEIGPVEDIAGAICVSYRVDNPSRRALEETLRRPPATVSFEVGSGSGGLSGSTGWARDPSDHKIVYDDQASDPDRYIAPAARPERVA